MDLWIWGAIGAALFAVEVLAPGYYLIFPAIGAFGVGLAVLAGVTTLELQLLLFAAFSGLLFVASFRRYAGLTARHPPPMVNSPDRLIGSRGTVEDALSHGRGKVRLGDSVWLARGPDLACGIAVRVIAVEGTVVVVEPIG